MFNRNATEVFWLKMVNNGEKILCKNFGDKLKQ